MNAGIWTGKILNAKVGDRKIQINFFLSVTLLPIFTGFLQNLWDPVTAMLLVSKPKCGWRGDLF